MHGLEHICRHRKPGHFEEALVLAVIAAGSFAIIHQSCSMISGTAPCVQVKKRESRLYYESEQARQLAESALRKFCCPESELYRMDADNNGRITEQEVLFYIRSK